MLNAGGVKRREYMGVFSQRGLELQNDPRALHLLLVTRRRNWSARDLSDLPHSAVRA